MSRDILDFLSLNVYIKKGLLDAQLTDYFGKPFKLIFYD